MTTITKIKGTFAEQDRRFLEEMVKIISTIDGSSKMHIRTNQLPSRIKCIVNEPPELSMSEIKQIELMNARIIDMEMNIQDKTFFVEVWKCGHHVRKKRKRDGGEEYLGDVPKRYKFDCQKEDRPVIENIIKCLLGMDQYLCEFDVIVKQEELYYDMRIKNIEPVKYSFIKHLNTTYRAFIKKISFDFPNSTLKIEVRRNDAPIKHLT